MSTSTIHPAIVDLLRFTRTHQRHHEALMRATGGHFNLFQVLGIGHYEVKTHSPLLAELLNPRGRHGQGSVFLKLFLKQFGIGEADFDAKSSKVTAEVHIGTKTEDTGGRIDIVIEDGMRRRILIENKIYAGDQERQLSRYRKFDDGARLFYLTLFGAKPSNLKPEEVIDTRCECISYADNIRMWLMDCRKEAACLPGVRETISQYIALIEELTHQSTTMEMNKELIQHIVETPENLQAFYMLRDAGGSVQTSLIAKLDEDLSRIVGELGLEKKYPAKDLHRKFGQFTFSTPSLERNNLRIGFMFDSENYRSLQFGFNRIDPELPCPVEGNLQAAFAERFALLIIKPWWPAYAAYEAPYRNWEHQAFEGVRSGRFAQDVRKKLISLLLIAEKVCGSTTDIKANPDPL